MESAISLPSFSASSLVDGYGNEEESKKDISCDASYTARIHIKTSPTFNFQFPLMNGLRASSLVAEKDCWGVVIEGEKAVADANREARRSFMVDLVLVKCEVETLASRLKDTS